jgi:Tol biopolymer transport system component
MRRPSALAAALGLGVVLVPPATGAPGDLSRVSLTDAGAEAPTASTRGVTSGDGRYVAFLSSAQLTTTPTNGRRQLYVRDRVSGRTVIVSARGGTGADQDVAEGDSFNPHHDISGNGRYVVFVSTAQNLVAADANGALADVFRADLVTGAIEVVSLTPAGQQGDQSVPGDPSISYDGTRIAFTTGTARNYVAGDVSNASDVVVRDTVAGTTTLASRNTAGQQANDFAERPAISADGRSVAFEAGPLTTNLFAGDANATNDVVVNRLDTGRTDPVGVAADGQVLGGGIPDISGDGRYVAFQSSGKLDPVNDGNAANDVYRRDTVAGVSTLVSAKNGVAANSTLGGSFAATSADGGRVAFVSSDVDLVAGDGNNQADVFSRVVATNATERASQRANGTETASPSETASVAGNGALVVFTSAGAFAQAPLADGNAVDDVYTKETAATDLSPPTLTATIAPGGGAATVSGTVGDPSGVGALTVNGTAVRPAADGSWTATVPVERPRPDEFRASATVVAVDGAGNRAEETRSFSVIGDPRTDAPVAPRITRVTRRVVRGRVVVTFRLSKAAKVRARLQKPRRVQGRLRFAWIGKGVVRTYRPGVRSVGVVLPRTAGTYRLRLTATSAGATGALNVVVRVPRRR